MNNTSPFPHLTGQARILGFTLTEIAIVLGIIGVIVGAVWTAAGTVNEKMRVNKVIGEIQVIASNVRALYADRSVMTASTDYTAGFINAGVFPPDMIDKAGNTINPWGTLSATNGGANGVSVGSKWNCGSPTTQFGVAMWGVPKDACISILTAFSGPTASDNGVACLDSVGTGRVASDGSADATIQASCSGSLYVVFNLH